MMRRLMMSWAAVVLMSGAALAEQTERADPVAGAFGEPRVIVPAPEDAAYSHLSWPKVVRATDGTLIVAYSAGVGHNTGRGSGLAVSISTDEGRTFSPPQVLAYFPRDDARYADCGNMALGVAEDGAIVLLAMAFRARQGNTIFGYRSEDHGRTWQPVDTSAIADSRTGSVYGSIVNVPGKGLAVAGHYRNESQPHQVGLFLSWSRDHGRTWSEAQRITDQALYEPSFTYADGRLIGLARPGSRADHYTLLVSEDQGETWTIEANSGVQTGDEVILPSPYIGVDAYNETRLIAMETVRTPGANVPGDIWLWIADVSDMQWRQLGQLVHMPNELGDRNDFGYPDMTALGDGRWFVVFYCGRRRGANDIYGMVIELPQDAQVE